jgi:hypothetical protein
VILVEDEREKGKRGGVMWVRNIEKMPTRRGVELGSEWQIGFWLDFEVERV